MRVPPTRGDEAFAELQNVYGVFVLSEDTARRAVLALALASHTGWSKGEILDMDVEELVDWVNTLEAMRPKR